MKNFKILLFYPNEPFAGIASSNLPLLAAYLKKSRFQVKLFDCTLYNSIEGERQEDTRLKQGLVKKTVIDNYIKIKNENIYDAFIKMVEEYKPNLIGITLVDSTIKFSLAFLRKIEDKNIPVVAGGIGATFNYEKIFKSGLVDYVCIGEGEEAIVELAEGIYKGGPCDNIKNIYCLNLYSEEIIKNPLRPLINMDKILIPDFSIYDDMRFYRPFMGGVYRMVQMDFDRGCQHGCTFCAAPSLRKIAIKSQCGRYYRVKSINKIFKEMKYLIKKYNLNFVWISSETLLDLSLEDFTKFVKRYKKEINLPCWCQSRLDTFTEEKTKLLAEMGCRNVSVGLEHGSEEIRNKILNKHLSNEVILKGAEMMAKYNIFPTLNNMVGLPDETREDVFETIKLNRKISVILNRKHNINSFTFIPFSGTRLRDICIEKGYIKKDDEIPFSFYKESMLTMPSLSKEEIKGLEKTLLLYILLPKSYYPDIKVAEQNNEEGQIMFEKLSKLLPV